MNRFIVFIAVIFGIADFGFGQVGKTSPERGSKLGHAYSVGEFDTINTTNGNLMFNFSLAALPPGRGSASAGINLTYNSKLYNARVQKFRDMRYSCNPEENGPENCRYYYKTLIEPSDKGGWQLGHSYTIEVEDRLASYGTNMPSCRSYGAPNSLWPEMTYIHKLWIVFPDGSRHEMHPQNYTDHSSLLDKYYRVRFDGVQEDCGGSQTRTGHAMTYASDDGSNLRLDFSYDGDTNSTNNTWTLRFPDGGRVTSGMSASGAQHVVYDRNGNYVQGLTDQFGRSISFATDTNGDWLVTSKGFNNASLVWRMKWKSIFVRKTYQSCVDDYTCPPEELKSNLEVQWSVVDTITEPSEMGGRTYTFSYNAHPVPNTPSGLSNGWGEVSGVDLPTGADISYAYAMDGQDGSTDFNLTKDILRNYPTTKTVLHDGETDTWTYATGLAGGNSYGPDGSGAENYFTSTEENSWLAGLTYKTEFKESATGNSIRKVEKIWAKNRNSAACDSSPARYSCNPYVKTEFTSIKAGGSYAWTAIKDFTYDKNGNVTEVREYDWMPYSTVIRTGDRPDGLPAGASSYLKRKTLTAHYYDTPEASTSSYTDPDSYYLNSSNKILRLVKSVEVQDADSSAKSRSDMVYDNNPSTPTAGNLTETKTWDSFKDGLIRAYSNPLTTTNSISMTASYNAYGMPTQTTDAKGNITTITYGYISGYYDLYPTQTVTASTTAVARTATVAHDFYSGLVTTSTDADNNLSTVTEYDSLGRPTKVRSGANTSLESTTTSDYNNTARRIIVRSDLETLGDGKKVAIQHFDELGRVRLSRTLENAANEDATNESHGIKVETKYRTDSGYSYQATSNPYRTTSDATAGWTRSTAYSNSIKQEVETFSGSALPYPWGSNYSSTGKVVTDIDANRTLVTDQAGKQSVSKTDGLGRLTDVWEIRGYDGSTVSVGFPGTSIAYGYQTSYGYDTLNNLTSVAQSPQTPRSFTYSSLSRLRTAYNPESGTITYGYDWNGNLTTKLDARSITTTYTYDELNRLKQRSYSNDPAYTPTVNYTYDQHTNSKGKLTRVASSVSTTEYVSFDIMGRVTRSKQITDGVTYGDDVNPMTYAYNLASALTEQKYPSGRVVKNTFDASGDVAMVQSKKNAASGFFSYADAFSYNAAGAVTSMQLGNGKWESTVFNSRLQPTQIALGTVQNGTDKLDLDYGYGSTNNNGNILSQTITVPGLTQPLVQNYTYDELNRLASAAETHNGSQPWYQVFGYDRYGNRNVASGAGVTNFSFSGNRVTAHSYDDAGNTTNDGSKTFTYDAENKQAAVNNGSTGQYWYDGDGKRVKTEVPGTGTTTVFVYDAFGRLAAEYSTSTPGNKVAYLTNDHLGSPRINTDQNGTVTARHDYRPFGEEILTAQRTPAESYTADTVREQFTGYERDDETGIDFAQARMYASAIGRFTSADPFNIILENQGESDRDKARDILTRHLLSPGKWNRYAYVEGKPLTLVDPSGLDALIVVFTDYKAVASNSNGRNVRLPTGHAGIVLINQDGSATYYEYGRYDKKGKGWVRNDQNTNQSIELPKLEFSSDGVATEESVKNMMSVLSEKYGNGSAAMGAYFNTNQETTNNMKRFADQQLRENENPDREPYAVFSKNCMTFTRDVLSGGGVNLSTASWSAIPGKDINFLLNGNYRIPSENKRTWIKPGRIPYRSGN